MCLLTFSLLTDIHSVCSHVQRLSSGCVSQENRLTASLHHQDHRVTWNDARHYMSALQSRDNCPKIQAWLFPEDSHALDRLQTEFEQWLNTVSWLKQFCGPKDV